MALAAPGTFAQTASARDNEIAADRLEEIVVLGQKIERPLMQTEDSVAVFPEDTIRERGLIDIADTIQQAPNVSGTGRSFRIRGIDSGLIGTLRSELASFYVDGVALSGWVKAEGPQQLWDVQQVEFLRGPQSTNLGRNSLVPGPSSSRPGLIRAADGSII